MEFWIDTASGLGVIYDGWDIDTARKPHKDAYVVPYGKLYRFKISINTLEELCNLIKETGHNLVVSEDTITIYDDYIE